ncbi:MAG: response regulator [Thermodesulfobacteriota bacterium]
MGKKKVMIFDDEEDFLEITKVNLEEAGGYDVLTFSNAKDIIAEVHRFEPDIILLDIRMPEVDGIDACQMLNNDSIGSHIPVIIVSALSKREDKVIAYKKGVAGYLVKPIEEKDLIAKIEEALRGFE